MGNTLENIGSYEAEFFVNNMLFDILKETATTAVIDANDGMGMVASKVAMDMCIEKARKYGLGMVAVRNSSHYGIAGYWSTMASKENMIGITGTN